MPLGKRYELYLPLYYNPDAKGERKSVETSKFEQTYQELWKKFGGVTTMPVQRMSALRGLWEEEGVSFEDRIVTAFVYTTDIEEADGFFRRYKQVLEERFQQKEVFILSWVVEKIESQT